MLVAGLAGDGDHVEAGPQRLDRDRREGEGACGDQARPAPADPGEQGREDDSGQGEADRHAGLLQREDHTEILTRHPLRQDVGRRGVDRPLGHADEQDGDDRRGHHRDRIEGEADGSHQQCRLTDAHCAQPHDRTGGGERHRGGDSVDEGGEDAHQLGVDRQVARHDRHHDAERQHAERDHHLNGQHAGHRDKGASHRPAVVLSFPPLRGFREGEVAPSYGDGGVMRHDMAEPYRDS